MWFLRSASLSGLYTIYKITLPFWLFLSAGIVCFVDTVDRFRALMFENMAKEPKKELKIVLQKLEDLACNQCDYTTALKQDLKKHMEVLHIIDNTRGNWTVEKRSKGGNESNNAVGKHFKCSNCDYKSPVENKLKRHFNAVHLKIKDFACWQCSFRSSYKAHLYTHMKSIHKGIFAQENKEDFDNQNNKKQETNLEPKISTMKEEIIPEFTNSTMNIKNPIKELTIVGKQSTISTLNTKKPIKELQIVLKKLKDMTCNECDYTTVLKHELSHHVKVMHNIDHERNRNCGQQIKYDHKKKYFLCEQCDYRTLYKSVLRRHIKAVHDRVKDFQCEKCNYKSSYKTKLERHVKAMHMKHKYTPVPTQKDDLKDNKKETHEDDLADNKKENHKDDFACDECNFKSPFRVGLTIHTEAVHNAEDFVTRKNIKQEMNPESTVSTMIIKKTIKEQKIKTVQDKRKMNFNSVLKVALKRHTQVVHMRLKKFTCKICKLKFNFAFNLKRHAKAVHMKIKEFSCEQCNFQSSYKSNLKNHVKSEHERSVKASAGLLRDYSATKKMHLTQVNAAHQMIKNFGCRHCDYQSKYRHGVQRHLQSSHNMDGNFDCSMREYTPMPTENDDLNDDKKENYADDIADNNKESNETSIKCKLCEFEAASKSLMIEHIMSNIMSHVSSN